MIRVMLFYFFCLLAILGVFFLVYGSIKKRYKIKVVSSYTIGASILILALLIQNPILAWILAIIALVFIVAPNNMKEVDFTKIG
jgi:hypothetical protein